MELVASVALHINATGTITGLQLFLAGFMNVGKEYPTMLFREGLQKEDYIRIENIDLSLGISWSSLILHWIPGRNLDWSFKIYNPNNNKDKVLEEMEKEKLVNTGANQMRFRIHFSLQRGLRIGLKLGVVPVHSVENLIGHSKHNFLVIQMGVSECCIET